MDSITRERSKKFIDQAKSKVSRVIQETEAGIKSLAEIYSQYSVVIQDLLEAKSKYVSIVEKYLEENPSSAGGDFFSGIQAKDDGFSKQEMTNDTDEMNQLAELVKDLEMQKDSMEDQLERNFKKSVENIHQGESLTSQASYYLDSLIEDIGEIYGSSTMNQLIQKNSV